jgi:hypothetical protein
MKKENCFFGILDIHKKFSYNGKNYLKINNNKALSLIDGSPIEIKEQEIVQVENVNL